ncbi:MAG TPA: hypothetical protein VGU20_31075 [Stellaceae bacterium]|nr:hypothetical protein [Stellaceae bacterium]
MEKRVLTVLRASEEFQPRHVLALKRQLTRYTPDAEMVCLSNVDVPGVKCIRAKYDWPDWWSKMEMCRPDIRGDFLLSDLDNVFVGSLDDILSIGMYTTQKGESNALAYMTEEVRARIWEEWMKNPEGHMHFWHPRNTPVKTQFGDGGFIKSLMSADSHWEDALPNQVINIAWLGLTRSGRQPWPLRLDRSMILPPEARVLLCWRPWRPWKVPLLRRFGMYDFV